MAGASCIAAAASTHGWLSRKHYLAANIKFRVDEWRSKKHVIKIAILATLVLVAHAVPIMEANPSDWQEDTDDVDNFPQTDFDNE